MWALSSLCRMMPVAIAVIALNLMLSSQPAAAAVRRCEVPVTASGAGKTEADAKRKAIEAWTVAAAVLGAPYGNWRASSGHGLTCTRTPAGEYACDATSKPCAIQQNPNAPPPAATPDPRGVPAKKSGQSAAL